MNIFAIYLAIMSVKSIIKNFISVPLNYFDLEIRRKHRGNIRVYNLPSCMERLEHIKKMGFSPKIIFDGGAYEGNWCISAKKLFPESKIVLFEPNPFIQNIIRTNLKTSKTTAIVKNIALGDRKKETTLNIWNETKFDVGASLLDHVKGKAKNVVKVKVDTLDGISYELGLIPDLIKLDLQGGELDALKGATNLLKYTELFIIEFGCLEAYKDRTTPKDLINIMYDNDFCLYDIVDLLYRPYDGALTGGDFFFLKNWSKLREHKGYE